METNTTEEEVSGDNPQTTPVVDQLDESRSVAERVRRQLNNSLPGLSDLAVILGGVVAYGAYGFRRKDRPYCGLPHGG